MQTYSGSRSHKLIVLDPENVYNSWNTKKVNVERLIETETESRCKPMARNQNQIPNRGAAHGERYLPWRSSRCRPLAPGPSVSNEVVGSRWSRHLVDRQAGMLNWQSLSDWYTAYCYDMRRVPDKVPNQKKRFHFHIHLPYLHCIHTDKHTMTYTQAHIKVIQQLSVEAICALNCEVQGWQEGDRGSR